MHLLIDGYNLLYVGRSLPLRDEIELQRERDHLIDQLAVYRRAKPCEITIVFDGWKGGWSTEKREKKKGIDLIFSKIGEKADEVIKRLVRMKGSSVIVITSDREVSKFAEGMSVTVIPSAQFMEKMAIASAEIDKGIEQEEGEERPGKGKGPSRRLSKKERRARLALKKL